MEIDELYNSGVSATEIGKKLGITRYKVVTKLRKLGVNVYNKQNEIKWDVNKAIELYHSGKTLSDISRLFGISVSIISIRFKKLKIPVTNYQNALKFDNTMFDVIDTEEKAYWLGFIYADGYVSKSCNNFELSLGLKDSNHLLKFAKFFKYENNVKTDSYRCRFRVDDKHLKQVFIGLGVIPQKSLILTFPKYSQVPKKLIHHFIRGYYDGDGCIITKETSGVKLGISILGTIDFLTGIINEVGIPRNITHMNDNAKVISFAVANSIIFCDYIYKDSTVFLDRKKNLYQNYLKIV